MVRCDCRFSRDIGTRRTSGWKYRIWTLPVAALVELTTVYIWSAQGSSLDVVVTYESGEITAATPIHLMVHSEPYAYGPECPISPIRPSRRMVKTPPSPTSQGHRCMSARSMMTLVEVKRNYVKATFQDWQSMVFRDLLSPHFSGVLHGPN